MKKSLMAEAGLLAIIAGIASSPAFAGNHVDWSINIGPPPVIYSPPPVVYPVPQAVYVQPQPVYVAPPVAVPYERVYYYDVYNRPYYIEHGRRFYHRGWHHHHGHH